MNAGEFKNITGDFVKNEGLLGGALFNMQGRKMGDLNGDFIANQSYYGGVVNYGNINSFSGNFVGNNAVFASGGVYNVGEVGKIRANFNNNEAGILGSSVFNIGKTGDINGNFIGNKTTGDFLNVLAKLGLS